MWDETVALYLDDPALGGFTRGGPDAQVFRLGRWDEQAAGARYVELLAGATG